MRFDWYFHHWFNVSLDSEQVLLLRLAETLFAVSLP